MFFPRVSALLTLAFTQSSALSIESFEGHSIDRDLRSGVNCLASARVTCTTLNKRGETVACNEGKTFLGREETCGDIVLNLTYEYCNDNDVNIIVKNTSRYKFKSEVTPIDEVNQAMGPGCKTVTTTETISTCKRKASFSIQYEGDVEGRASELSYHCYEFAFVNLEFRTQAPTPAPTTPPIPTDIPPCVIESTIDCTFNDTGEKCSTGGFTEGNVCVSRAVTVDYEFCNRSSEPVNLDLVKTIAKFRADVVPISGNELAIDGCKKVSRGDNFNCNTNKKFAFSLKVEGSLTGRESQVGAYCYAWAFDDVKLPKPVTKLRTTCFINNVSGVAGENKECKFMRPITSNQDCVRQLTYTYYITNNLSNDVKSKGVVVRISGGEVEILEGIDSGIAKDNEVMIATHVVTKNLCEKPKGEPLKNNVVAVIANEDGGVSSTKAFDYDFVPKFEQSDCVWDFDDEYKLQCVIQGQQSKTCTDYINELGSRDECLVEVLFSFKIKNEGLVCCDVTNAESYLLEASGDDNLFLGEDKTCGEDRLFCPGNDDNSWTIEQAKTIDLCQFTGAESEFKVSINDGDDKVMIFELPAPPISICLDKSNVMTFSLVENSCDLSTLTNVFSCTQGGCLDFGTEVKVVITDEEGLKTYNLGSDDFVAFNTNTEVVAEAEDGELLPDNLVATVYQKDSAGNESAVQRLLINSCFPPSIDEEIGVLRVVSI
eukprot:CAMPEP_0198249710 /NCGR_PEP_ID=MMETSP1447-20131203/1139_1 /TAXON_ID=420782 /ORGANISM="Chaetoceros dichaeta, Strain CCMP1751" /LENGTH=712 /DNA_ID=CAMNT_0043934397 /DNA_START=74 /DNA_END=2212 /DNA_ORIENTATION=-